MVPGRGIEGRMLGKRHTSSGSNLLTWGLDHDSPVTRSTFYGSTGRAWHGGVNIVDMEPRDRQNS
jgi:hypothetical protein